MFSEDSRVEKERLRAILAARRAAQPPAVVSEKGAAAQRALLASAHWQKARQVVLYMAVRGEMPTDMLLDEAWGAGRRVLLPRCRRDEPGVMDFVPCAGRGDLSPGRFGIPEPSPRLLALDWDDPEFLPDVLATPGVAFDRRGFRLGHGGGYYDRALGRMASRRECLRAGLAFAWQVLDSLPAEPWDHPVDCLCTEEGVIWL